MRGFPKDSRDLFRGKPWGIFDPPSSGERKGGSLNSGVSRRVAGPASGKLLVGECPGKGGHRG